MIQQFGLTNKRPTHLRFYDLLPYKRLK